MVDTLISFVASTNLEPLSIFQIGNNNNYFDEGKTTYVLENNLVSSIETTVNKLANVKEEVNLFIDGKTLSWINENSTKTKALLRKFAKSRFVNLVTAPYFNTNITLLSDEEFTHQIKLHKDLTKKIFGRLPSRLVITDAIPDNIYKLLKKHKITKVLPIKHLETGIYEIEAQETDNCELKEHLKTELITFHKILKDVDEDSLNDWRVLGSTLNQPTTYETYISTMNVLNDMSFKIENILRLKQGQELRQPVVVDNPSQVLEEFWERGIRDNAN